MTKTPVLVRGAVAGGAALLLGAGGLAVPAGAEVASRTPTSTIAAHAAPKAVPLGTGFRPEGVESGPGDRYYVGSLADGRIRTGDLSRGTGRTLLAGVEGRALRGLYYDGKSKLLWAAGNDGTTAIVLAVDARSGKVVSRTVVPGALFLNDLVVSGGSVWVTDSQVDRLTRIPLDEHGRAAGGPSFVPLTGDWPLSDATPRANGVVAFGRGTLLLNNSASGGLWAVPTAGRSAGVAKGVPISGGPGISGGDGLELVGSTLYNVRGSGQQEVSVLELDRSKRGGLSAQWRGALTSPLLDVPSTATFANGRLWAVNARFGVADPAAADYSIVPLSRRPA